MGRTNHIAPYGITLVMAGSTVLSPAAIRPAVAQTVDPIESVVSAAIAAAPGRDSSAYSPPSAETVDGIVAGVSDLVRDEKPTVDAYDLVTVGVGNGEASALVEEGNPHAGNGLYAVRSDSAAQVPLIVQVPHPIAEFEVEKMGTQLFATTESELFMMAGAHRTAGGGSADVAHRADTAFAAVNEAVVEPGATVVQLHGFSQANHQTDFGDIVVSSSVDEPSPAVRKLADDLRGGGFETCMYDGENCGALAGTVNVEADAAHAHGAEFIHIEVDQDVRRDAGERTRLVNLVAQSLKASGIG
ncbi:hypothetical protein [Rhodococcus sp. NPDC058521]|uniref:hypothetical protein n=1 Tax=Rhodococcus sp. NPDC058521 TaxID=3346536 RepID=UPI003655F154